jgi:hypothetical protein
MTTAANFLFTYILNHFGDSDLNYEDEIIKIKRERERERLRVRVHECNLCWKNQKDLYDGSFPALYDGSFPSMVPSLVCMMVPPLSRPSPSFHAHPNPLVGRLVP